ncbi:MAG TPA: methylisocitrate lyase [Candidatus Bathyarchaeia archaeon]|nr:methylisocitrate lyase [Candidatus Bathyarchaeia archaeon]
MKFVLKYPQEKLSSAILRNRISAKKILVAPGVFSPVIARLAQDVGFEGLYFSGGGFANLLSLPDLGMTTLTEVADAVRHITSAVSLPVIVDVDTGFGEAVNVARTVRDMEAAGAAAVHIEDQIMPKRCGHLAGKQLVDVAEMVKKIIIARDSSQLVVIARTDARGVEGLDSAIERARAYIKAGAEVIFPEALESKDEFAEFSRKIRAPLLANMTEFGKTPYLTVSEFKRLGYRIVIFPMTAFRTMLFAVRQTLQELNKSGTQKKMLGKMMSRDELYRLIDYYSYADLDKQAMSASRKLLRKR